MIILSLFLLSPFSLGFNLRASHASSMKFPGGIRDKQTGPNNAFLEVSELPEEADGC